MTTDAGTHDVVPDLASDSPTSQDSAVTDAQPPMSAKEKKERPKTVLALIEYAYGESGRKLSLARKDLRELSVDASAEQAEIDSVRRLASGDPFLAVPPNLLATLAELGPEPPVLRRILELVLVAFASHKVFEGRLERLADAQAQPALTAREVSEAAKGLTFHALGLKEASEFKEATRERLRVNAITAFELFRVLRDRWTSDQFVEDMAALVWDVPIQRSAPKAAALLATAKNTDALSQLSRHFEVLLRDSKRETGEARVLATQNASRAESAEAVGRTLSADLKAEQARTADLLAQTIDLTRRLTAEQSSRVVDKSHLVDDYEALRTQVIRRLTVQVELLSDGLHALRNGSPSVAEEFVDRALSSIDGEVTRLKDLDGGAQ